MIATRLEGIPAWPGESKRASITSEASPQTLKAFVMKSEIIRCDPQVMAARRNDDMVQRIWRTLLQLDTSIDSVPG